MWGKHAWLSLSLQQLFLVCGEGRDIRGGGGEGRVSRGECRGEREMID